MVFRSQGSLCSVNVAIQTGPSKVRVVGSNPGTGKFFFFISFPPLLSFPFLIPCVYPGVCASVGRVLRVFWRAFLP